MAPGAFPRRLHAVVAAAALAAPVALAALVPPFARAHHSHASLNPDDIQQLSGIVQEYVWRMPHVFLRIDGPNRAGEVVEWTIELMHPAAMIEQGWARDSFATGDRITWEGTMDRDPNRYYTGLRWAERGDGTLFVSRGGGAAPVREVQPSADFSGLWVRDTARTGFHYTPPADWPYTDFAQPLVDNFDETSNPQYDCENPGPPKSTMLPYPVKMTWLDDSTLELAYDMRDQRRIVHFGGAPAPKAPSKTGVSRGRMEGDDLVVETTGFVADRWGNHTGVDSSEQKHLVERFSLIDDGLALRIQMTLADTVYLREPVEIDYYMRKIPDRDVMAENCSLEAARLYVEAGYQ